MSSLPQPQVGAVTPIAVPAKSLILALGDESYAACTQAN